MDIVEYFLKEYENFRNNTPKHINKQDWEESLQETYISLLNVKDEVSYKKTYINTAARRNTTHIVSKRKTIGSRLDEVKVHIETTSEIKTPEQVLLENETILEKASQVYKMTTWINELPEKQQAVMKDVLSGLTVAEVGRKRNWNVNTTKHHYLLGLNKLKQRKATK